MSRFEKFVPELAFWGNEDGISLSTWISGVGRYDHFIGYLELIWPSFKIVDDTVFIESMWDQGDYDFYISNNTTKALIQEELNQIDLSCMFLGAEENVSEEFLIYIANSLKESWEIKLKTQFPSREFQVVLDNSLSDPQSDELNLYFYEK